MSSAIDVRPALKSVISLLFPRSCLLCKRDIHQGGPLCVQCLGSMRMESVQHGSSVMESWRSAAPFEGRLRDALHAYKYGGKDYLTKPLMDLWMRQWESPAVDWIVPVPMPFWREMNRGYNQAALLARELGARLNRPVAETWLARGFSSSQTRLSRAARRSNAETHFRAGRKPVVRGSRVLLVDDIATTGATLDACARILLKGGAASVTGAVLAREELLQNPN